MRMLDDNIKKVNNKFYEEAKKRENPNFVFDPANDETVDPNDKYKDEKIRDIEPPEKPLHPIEDIMDFLKQTTIDTDSMDFQARIEWAEMESRLDNMYRILRAFVQEFPHAAEDVINQFKTIRDKRDIPDMLSEIKRQHPERYNQVMEHRKEQRDKYRQSHKDDLERV